MKFNASEVPHEAAWPTTAIVVLPVLADGVLLMRRWRLVPMCPILRTSVSSGSSGGSHWLGRWTRTLRSDPSDPVVSETYFESDTALRSGQSAREMEGA